MRCSKRATVVRTVSVFQKQLTSNKLSSYFSKLGISYLITAPELRTFISSRLVYFNIPTIEALYKSYAVKQK